MIGSLTTSNLTGSTVIEALWAVQIFRDEAWVTIYLCSFAGDAEVAYHDALELSTLPTRLVKFRVVGAEFVSTYATDYMVCESVLSRG